MICCGMAVKRLGVSVRKLKADCEDKHSDTDW